MDGAGNPTSVDTYDSDFTLEEIREQTERHFKELERLMTEQEAIIQLDIMATNLIGDMQEGNELAVRNYDALDKAIMALKMQIKLKKRIDELLASNFHTITSGKLVDILESFTI